MKLVKKYQNPSGPIYSTIALPEVTVKPNYPRMPKESDYMTDEQLAEAFAIPQEYQEAAALRYLQNLYHTDYGKFKKEWERLHPGSTAEGRQAIKDQQAVQDMTQHIHQGTAKAAKVGIPMMLGAVGAPIVSSIGAVGNGLTALGTNFPTAVKGTQAALAGLGLLNFGSSNGVAKTGNKFGEDWTNFLGTRQGWTTDLLNPEGDRGWFGSFVGDLIDIGLAAPYLRRFYNASNVAANRQAASLGNLNFFPEDFQKVEDLVKGFNPDQYTWLKAHPGYQVVLENPGQLRVLKTGPTEQSLQVKGPEGFKILTRLMGQTEGNKIAQQAKEAQAAVAANLKKLKKLPEEVRNRYLSALEEHTSEILEDNYNGLDWSIGKVHAGMPIDKLLERRAIDEKWLTDYYNNVTNIMIPLEKQLRNSGDLVHGSMVNGSFVPGKGYWHGKVGGSYTRVNPYYYVASRSPNFQRTNNIYAGYANEQTSGIKFDNFLTSFPRADRRFSIYTVEGMGDKSQKLRNWYTNWTGGDGATGNSGRKAVRYQVPIIDQKNLQVLPLSGSTEGTSAGGPLIDQIGRAPIIKFMGEDKGFYPVRINVYDSSVPDIKSWWNNFNFNPGAGPLAYNDNKTNNNNNLV